MRTNHQIQTFLIISLLALSSHIYSQANKIPPFRMTQSNGMEFRAEQLPFNKPVVLIYFSPECEHCTTLVKELLLKERYFRKSSIVLITFMPINVVTDFVYKYRLTKHRNIYTGTDGGSFFLKNYYNLKQRPFAALYNKEGELLNKYSRPQNLDEMISRLKDL